MNKIFLFAVLFSSLCFANQEEFVSKLSNEEQLICGLVMIENSKKEMKRTEQFAYTFELLRITGYSVEEARELLYKLSLKPGKWVQLMEKIETVIRGNSGNDIKKKKSKSARAVKKENSVGK